MLEWLSGLFKWREYSPKKTGDAGRVLALESQAQSLRLELDQAQQTIQRLQNELERQRTSSETLLTEKTQAQIENLLGSLAAPLAQLVTLNHLAQEKPVQPQDVLAVGQRLLVTLRQHGLELEGQIGERLPFDPDRHTPLSAENIPQPGQTVSIRFVGILYHGKLLHKAGVS